jgi:hypothetical protein
MRRCGRDWRGTLGKPAAVKSQCVKPEWPLPGLLVTPYSVCSDILLRAANSLGSSTELAQRLHVAHDTLRGWMRGELDAPTDILMLALELLERR